MIFKEESVFKTIILCMLTLGGYLMYKLYTFSEQINENTEMKISKLFITITIILFSVSLTTLAVGLFYLPEKKILISSLGLHVFSTVFDISWILMVRNRMNLITGAKKGEPLWLDPLKTSLLHVIYMQHKINQGMSKAPSKNFY
ncbi:hypothetical protein AB4238_13230 [Shewanella sp. 10N.286.45.A1]|uniref:hypothetical protein n=1 Tax=Shewanella sp. 10N.286.45.A1 TaxID=3229694 RepID=UPI0035530C89